MRGYTIGRFTLDLDRQQLFEGGRPVALTRKNFEVLRELTQAGGRIVSRDDLVRSVWPDAAVEDATLRQNVYTLRTLLRQLDPEREYLETIPKTGYRILVPVEPVTRGEAAVAAPSSPPLEPPAVRWRWVGALAVPLLLAAIWLMGKRWPAPAEAHVLTQAAELTRQGWLILDRRDGELYPGATALFDDALRLDPHSADAHAGKALLYTLAANEPAAEAEAARVQQLDPASGVPYAVRGFLRTMYHWDWTGGGRLLEHSQGRPCPDPFCRQWYGLYLGLTGRFTLAVRETAGSVEMAPGRVAPRAQYGQMLYWAGETDAALRELQTVVAAAGGDTHARLHLWKAQLAAGERDAACQTLLMALEPAWFRLPAEDPFLLLRKRTDWSGKPEFFRRALEGGKVLGTNAYFLAEIAMAMGDEAETLGELEQALARRVFFLPYAKRDPLFVPLHGNPRYEAVMKQVGL